MGTSCQEAMGTDTTSIPRVVGSAIRSANRSPSDLRVRGASAGRRAGGPHKQVRTAIHLNATRAAQRCEVDHNGRHQESVIGGGFPKVEIRRPSSNTESPQLGCVFFWRRELTL